MRNPIVKTALCAAALLALVGCPDTDPPQTIRGPLDLTYTVETSPSRTSGTGRKPVKVNAIHFYESYIVFERTTSGGEVLPVEKIRHLSWSKSDSGLATKDYDQRR